MDGNARGSPETASGGSAGTTNTSWANADNNLDAQPSATSVGSSSYASVPEEFPDFASPGQNNVDVSQPNSSTRGSASSLRSHERLTGALNNDSLQLASVHRAVAGDVASNTAAANEEELLEDENNSELEFHDAAEEFDRDEVDIIFNNALIADMHNELVHPHRVFLDGDVEANADVDTPEPISDEDDNEEDEFDSSSDDDESPSGDSDNDDDDEDEDEDEDDDDAVAGDAGDENPFDAVLAAGNFIMRHIRNRHPSAPVSLDGDAVAMDENAINELKYESADDAVRHIYLNPSQMTEVTREGNDILLPSNTAAAGDKEPQPPMLLTLPIIQLHDVTVFPLRTIPLWLHEPHHVATFSYCVANNVKQIAVLRRTENDFDGELHARYGCTVFLERYESNDIAATQYNPAHTQIKAVTKGSQRFRLHSAKYTEDQVLLGKIEVLPEFDMPAPDFLLQSRADKKQFSASKFDFSDSAVESAERIRRTSRQKERFLCYIMNTSLPVTPQLLLRNDSYALMREIRREFAVWHYMSFPDEPRNFAYHVASAIPCDDAGRENLLALPSTLHRLQAILEILLKLKFLTCQCNAPLAGREHIFCMTTEGAMGSFVNPSGAVHETITTYRLVNGAHNHIRLLGRPTIENTWFPGYAWTCALCRECRAHLGWRFTIASGDKGKDLFSRRTVSTSSASRADNVSEAGDNCSSTPAKDDQPKQVKSFWGFRRASVKPAAVVQLYNSTT